jgi:adenylate kinase family enzyme
VRLNEFRTKTMPVVEFYKNKGSLITVDGTTHPDQVTQQILEQLEARI